MNWRHQLVINRRKTYVLFMSFMLMYVLLGALTAILLTPHYGFEDWGPILMQPHSHQIILVFLAVSIVIILVAVLFGGKLSLAGTGAKRVSAQSENPQHKQLYNIVEEMKIASGLRFMPKVYVMPVQYMNAFAAG